MRNPLTFREMIAYRPLLFAWVWEMLCVAVALYVALTDFSEALFIGLCFAGAVPFAAAFLLFWRARNAGELSPKSKGDIVQ